MKPKVYLETSVISYLTAEQSPDVIIFARQQITKDWWLKHRGNYELFVSDAVEREAGFGDAVMSDKRLRLIEPLTRLATSEQAIELAEALITKKAVPANASADALHIAIATVEKINFLMSWNFKHIVNAQMQDKIEKACSDEGFKPSFMCTPESLVGGRK